MLVWAELGPAQPQLNTVNVTFWKLFVLMNLLILTITTYQIIMPGWSKCIVFSFNLAKKLVFNQSSKTLVSVSVSFGIGVCIGMIQYFRNLGNFKNKTSLISIESQPKKIVFVVMLVIGVVVGVVIPVVDTRNIHLKFGWNQVINRWDVVDVVVVVSVFVFVVVVVVVIVVIVDPRNLPLKLG